MSEVIDTMETFRRRLLERDAEALHEMARRWLQVEQQLQAYAESLAEELARMGPPVTTYQLSRMRRYRALMEQVGRQLERYQGYVGEDILARQRSEAFSAFDEYDALIRSALADIGEGAVTGQFDRMSPAAVERIVGAAQSPALRRVLNDASLLGADALTQQLAVGVALGKNPNEIARMAIRAGLGRSFTRFATIARTEVMRTHRQTIREGFAQSRVVTGYRRVASKSMRTCLACLILDGTIYPVEVEFASHPNCRCQLVPILKGREAIDYTSGREWLEGLDEKKKTQIMGPGLYDLWSKGKIGLDEIVRIHEDPTWGPSPRSRTLLEMQDGRN